MDSIQWLGPVKQDHMYDSRTQSWWLKAKLGGIRLTERDNPSGKCIMCGDDNENILHFYQCESYPGQKITDVIHINNEIQDNWTWLLHTDRQIDIRMQVSHWIHSRWKIRARNLASHYGNGRIPAITERRKKRTVEPGTAVPVDAAATIPDRETKTLKAEIQREKTPTRRGPPRACKGTKMGVRREKTPTRRCPPRACKGKRNQSFTENVP